MFVDDGSSDDTFQHLFSIAEKDSNVQVLKLSRNSGSHAAIRAGLEHARGEYACFLPCDLQEPPSLIPEMLAAMKEDFQVVWAVRRMRQDGLMARILSRIFFWLARHLVSKKLPPSGASTFLLGPRALQAVRLFRERNLTLEGLFLSAGFEPAYIPYDRQARTIGRSKFTLAKHLELVADFFVASSYLPLRMMSYLGGTFASLGFLYAMVIIIRALSFSSPILGWSSLMVVVLVMGGLQMLMMGVIGEYLWRTLDEVRARPRYILDRVLNGENSDSRAPWNRGIPTVAGVGNRRGERLP